MTIDDKFRVVVGIDFGTSRSGYAYAFTLDNRIIGQTEWPGQPVPYIKTLTQLLYSPDKKIEAWGYEARIRLAQLRKSKEANNYHFFKNFKMQLREGQNRNQDGPIIITNNQQKFLVLDLISDYLKLLKELALKEIKQATSGFLKDNEILWCLTIPAIWTDADKQLMRRAAEKAGLIDSSSTDAERLLLVLEPEAAAIYCQEKDQSRLSTGTRFMIVDCGGGTVDITVHEVVKGKGLVEVAKGTGGAYGSTYVDRGFQEHLEKILTSEVIDRFHNEEPIDYLEMMADWERTKCGFDPQRSGNITNFPIRSKLYKMLLKHYPQILKQIADTQDGEDEFIYLSSDTMQAIFHPTLNGLVNQVEEQFHRLGRQGCDLIYLVGGFSTSPILRQLMQEKFGQKVKKIVMPPIPGEAIVIGSVSFGLDPSVIRARRSRLTYGCLSSEKFNPDLDPKSKRFFSDDKQDWFCRERFSIFVIAGESVEVDEKILKTFLPMERNQTKMSFKFYATKNIQVRYTDEPGVENIGEMIVEMPDTTGGLNRIIEVTMYFGKTEIKVEGKDQTSGKQFNTTLRFSSTYSPELLGV